MTRYERRVVIDLVFVFSIWLQFVVYEKKKKNWNSDPDSDSRTNQLLFRLMMKLGKTKKPLKTIACIAAAAVLFRRK